ncbi:serine carboxypeptidase-like 17 [Eucalyptus grandis]|uniref:serine carboxypeptidase-like 17 n=1 Tax=Eucalyptus grandis TaxID=71139 RepID=UPI00192EC695|nr:serine carboxypeptidase-like 17 [Eucalyptus grandis]
MYKSKNRPSLGPILTIVSSLSFPSSSSSAQARTGMAPQGALACYLFLHLLLALAPVALSQKVVTTLPGYDGELPFYLETGYIGVGELEESQLFYYFVESQRSPALDPLMLWLTGGPGCSVLSAFFYESGPVEFSYVGYNGSLPSMHVNPHTWTQGLNIIYVDAPIGTGFSYSTTAENYYIDDYRASYEIYQFLRKWLIQHPQFLKNILYIGGDSYSGIPLPMVVKLIYDGNGDGAVPYLNLKGYVLGNPKTDDFVDDNSRVPFAHRLTLISTEQFEEATEACNGDFVNINASNADCDTDIGAIDVMVEEINLMHVLEPICQVAYSRPAKTIRGKTVVFEEDYENFLATGAKPAHWCRDYNYVLSAIWANDKTVRAALGVREGTKGVWNRCNSSLAYTKSVTSSVGYHQNLSTSNLRALIYSGDHDMSVTHIGTQNWIYSLNLTLYDVWRPWFVDGQIAGYTQEFINDDFTLDYATIKGAGHVAPEYKPKQCYEMLDRWLAYYPL